jgi:hypothetical protein
MKHHFIPLRYREEDRALLTVDQLSEHARVSRAFIRLCICLGCPTEKNLLSQAMLLDWLFENFEAVRRRCGLEPMAPLDGMKGEMLLKLKMGNALLTLLEFSATRSSNPEEKRRIGHVRKMVALSLDRR